MFRDRDNDQLERDLRAMRKEPSRRFVRELAARLQARPSRAVPRARFVLVGVLTAAVLAASASAHILTIATTTTSHVVSVVHHLTASHVTHRVNGMNHGGPSHDQYATQCGIAPAAQCIVEVEPDCASVQPGGSVTFSLILQTPGHSSGITADTSFTVNWTTANGTAIGGTDYPAGEHGSVTFAKGDSTASVTVTTLATSSGGNKKFSVVWSPQGSAAVMDSDDASSTITITNPPPAPTKPKVQVSPGNQSIWEGKQGTTTTLTFKVSLDKAATGPVTVHYATADGSATVANNDYQPASGDVNFNTGGKGPVNVSVVVVGDNVKEQNETFALNFSVTSGQATIDSGNATRTITILNDDNSWHG